MSSKLLTSSAKALPGRYRVRPSQGEGDFRHRYPPSWRVARNERGGFDSRAEDASASDALLVLAATASQMMQEKFRYLLPPLGNENGDPTRFSVLVVATKTGVLAIGCLTTRRKESDSVSIAAIFPFLLILVVGWLMYSMKGWSR